MAEVLNLAEPLRPRPGKGTPTEQAEAWLAYLYSGMATDAGRQQFSQWLREAPAHAPAYAHAEQLWRDLGLAAADQDAQRSLPRVPRARPALVAPRRRRWPARIAIAAMLVLAVGIASWQVYDYTQTRFTSATGEIRTVELRDGSTVTLSGDSRIIARIGDTDRRVELVRGRAFFDVSPDTARPFHVKAAATDIRVVGTAFDVNRSPSGVQVAVTEGVVQVFEPQTVTRIATAAPEVGAATAAPATAVQRTTTLTAGQKVKARLDGALDDIPQAFDADAELGWRRGRLHYVNTRLDTVIAEVNRYREHKIMLADPRLGAYSVTTSFRTDQTDQLLSGLATSYPVLISQTGDRVVVRAR